MVLYALALLLNLTTPAVAGATYAWTGPNGFSSAVQNPNIAAVTLAAGGVYNVTVTVGGCTSAAGSTTVAVNPVPVVIDQTASIISGGTFTVTPASVPVGTTYTWTAPTYTGGVTGGSAQVTPQPDISGTLTIPSGTGTATYTVTPVSGTCIGATFTVTVTVTSACVPVTIGTQPADNSMCVTSGNASFTVVANGTAPTYQWEYNNGGTWAAVANGTPAGAVYASANTATLSVSGITVAGSYQYRSFSTNCGGVNNATSNVVTLTVIPVPSTPTASNNGPLCVGATLNLTTPAVVGATYAWTGPNSFSSTLQNPTIAGVTLAAAGTYNVTVTLNGCTSIAGTTAVVVNAVPATPTASNNGPLCVGATLNLTTPAVVGATYAWTGPNSFSSTLQNPTIAGVTLAAAGIYNVTVTVGGCSSAAGTTTVAVNPVPVVVDQTASIISGGTFTVTPASVPVGTTYTWSAPTYTGGVTGGSAQATPQPDISGTLTIPSGTGTATYTVTPVSGTCIGATFTVTVTVTSGCVPVTIGTQPADNSMCVTSGNASFTVVANGTAPTYQWEYNNGGTWAAVASGTPAGAVYANANTATLSVSGITAAGSYQYRSYITNCGGFNNATSAFATLTVNAIPATPAAANNGPLCVGSTLNLTTPLVAGATYAWTGPNSFSSALQNPSAAGVTLAAAGVYNVTVTVGGCTSATGSTTVTVNPIPTINATANNPVNCGTDGSIDFTFTNVPNGTYTITYAAGSFTNVNVTGGTATVSASAGVYDNLEITTGGCTSAAGISIVIQPASMTGTATITTPIPCSGGTATVTLTGTGGTAPLTYIFNGVTNTTGVFTGIPAGAAYAWTISDAGGCTPATGSLDVAQPGTMTIISQPIGQTDCYGNEVEFSVVVNGGSGTITYQWQQRPPSGSFTDITGATGALLTINNIGVSGQNINGTQYQVIIQDACQTLTSDAASLNVNSITEITPTDENSVICNIGGSMTYAVSTEGSSPAAYQWLKQNGASWDPIVEGGSYSGTTTSQLTISNATSTQSGSYRVTVTFNTLNQPPSEATCAQTSSAWIRDLIVRDPLVRPVVSSGQSICNNTTPATLTSTAASGGSGPFTYQWESSPDGLNPWTTIAGETTLSYSPPPLTSTTFYRIVATDTGIPDCGFINSLPVEITVNTIPATPAASNNGPLCVGATLTLTTPAVVGAVYAWTGPNGFSAAVQNPTIAGVTLADAGVYDVTVTAGGCISAAGSTTVVVNAVPATPTASNNGTLCAGATLNLTTPAVVGATYAWTGPNSFSSTLQNPTIAGVTLADAGVYNVTVTVGGCTSAAGTTTVDVNPVPVVIDQTASIISGGTFTVTPAGVPAGTTYTWTAPTYTGGVTGGSAQVTPQPDISGTLTIPSGTGTATYTVTPVSGTCIGATFTVTVTVTSSCVPVTIGTQPADNSMCVTSGNASFTVVANGTSPYLSMGI